MRKVSVNKDNSMVNAMHRLWSAIGLRRFAGAETFCEACGRVEDRPEEFGNLLGFSVPVSSPLGCPPMVVVLSATSLFAGGALSYASIRAPEHTERYELWSGRLLLAGLVLIGACLPLAR